MPAGGKNEDDKYANIDQMRKCEMNASGGGLVGKKGNTVAIYPVGGKKWDWDWDNGMFGIIDEKANCMFPV